MNATHTVHPFSHRFRGFLPVVVDVETGGFDQQRDALLEIAAVFVDMDESGKLRRGTTHSYEVQPFPGAHMDPEALAFTGIDPLHPLRPAIPERDALQRVFRAVRQALSQYDCTRAILVGHNSFFDLGFVNAATARSDLKRSPFHPFSSFDTATLAGVAVGQTVLARAVAALGLDWDPASAHAAAYDAEKTADLFCEIVNRFGEFYQGIDSQRPGEISAVTQNRPPGKNL